VGVGPEGQSERRGGRGGVRAAEGGPLRNGQPPAPGLNGQGKEGIRKRLHGLPGAKGDGNGLAATFLFPRPRDFTIGVFKFRSTPSGSLPTDGDLFRTITRGVRWTAMPTWHEIPDKDRFAVITYIKTLSPRWKEEKPE